LRFGRHIFRNSFVRDFCARVCRAEDSIRRKVMKKREIKRF
jgi:hypothetical protein